MNYVFSNLQKKYNNRKVLEVKKMEIPVGKITCIIGGNGAGKTTLLNLLENSILTNGNKEYNDIIVSYVWQQPYLFDLPIVKNLEYPMTIRNISIEKINHKLEEIDKLLFLKSFYDRKPDQLSGGEKQRVAIGRSIIYEPNILLLDEPTANIDPESKKIIENVIVDLSKMKKTTIVWVTHSITQAQKVADYIIFMDKGEIIEAGEPNQILFRPIIDRTKEFINSEVLIWGK